MQSEVDRRLHREVAAFGQQRSGWQAARRAVSVQIYIRIQTSRRLPTYKTPSVLLVVSGSLGLTLSQESSSTRLDPTRLDSTRLRSAWLDSQGMLHHQTPRQLIKHHAPHKTSTPHHHAHMPRNASPGKHSSARPPSVEVEVTLTYPGISSSLPCMYQRLLTTSRHVSRIVASRTSGGGGVTTKGFRGPFIPFAEDPPLGAFIPVLRDEDQGPLFLLWDGSEDVFCMKVATNVPRVLCHRCKTKGCHMKGS
jgi:hypothetical protein